MFKKTVIAAGIGLALSSAAHADYQFELGANGGQGEVDLGEMSADQEGFGLTGTYYLKSVDTSAGPLAEAAFLDRASGVTLDYFTGELDGDNDDVDVDRYAVEGRYVSKESGWLVDLGYRLDEIGDAEVDTYKIGAGWYVMQNTAVVVSYANSDSDITLRPVPTGASIDSESDTYALDVNHLWQLPKGALKIDAKLALVDPEAADTINIWGLDGTYYLTDKLGFGADYSASDSDETELESWSLYASWFVTEKVALSLAYSEQEDDKIGFESDAFMFNANMRF
jgi:hypothetical protein